MHFTVTQEGFCYTSCWEDVFEWRLEIELSVWSLGSLLLNSATVWFECAKIISEYTYTQKENITGVRVR